MTEAQAVRQYGDLASDAIFEEFTSIVQKTVIN
jgi:hypothetical protein